MIMLFAFIARRFPKFYFKMISHEFGEVDHEAYARLRVSEFIRPDRDESYRQWGRGLAHDMTIPGTWPIPLEQISIKVHLWQGELDISVPPASSRYIAEKIPDCEATFIPEVGHFWIFEHMGEVLDTLVPQQS